MSFSAYANHVRNPVLPHKWREAALRSCVQLYRPIGFEATLSFLEELAGPFRGLWHDHLRTYAAQRHAAKRLGHRTPRPDDTNPNLGPSIWYGHQHRDRTASGWSIMQIMST